MSNVISLQKPKPKKPKKRILTGVSFLVQASAESVLWHRFHGSQNGLLEVRHMPPKA